MAKAMQKNAGYQKEVAKSSMKGSMNGYRKPMMSKKPMMGKKSSKRGM